MCGLVWFYGTMWYGMVPSNSVGRIQERQLALQEGGHGVLWNECVPFRTPPPLVIATPKYGINTVPTPTVAITKAWLAHDTYNYRHTRERMHGVHLRLRGWGR